MKKTQKYTPSVRLPRHILPNRYAITLKPDLESFTFEGEEVISVAITKPESKVQLHSSEIEIVTAEFIGKVTKPVPRVKGKKAAKKGSITTQAISWASKITYNEKAQTACLIFPKPLPKGTGKLKLVFRGVLNDKLRGYYRSSFTHNGQTKYLATTQFEATDARRAFPCFDEPNMKAVFDVTLVVPNGHTAISNTLPAIVKEHEAGFKAVTFKPTPKMSTYLVAFVSGELESIEQKTKSKVLVRIFTTPGKTKQARFALDFTVKALEFYEKYFGIPYPLPALDLLAIPDFMSAAMENWGAITFRESQLVVDDTQSATATKQRVATVIAHELAHQWFGNLVTMDWWTHLWLNEGFASYIEYLAVEHIYPQWHMWNQFMVLDYAAGMSKDELVHTHPIEVDVKHPDEIDEIFDDISYRKGSSVIRMVAEYLGQEEFRKGLQYYLKQHAYKNASTADLWLALEKTSKKPVRKIMSAWTRQAGFPLLEVEQASGKLLLSQKRFFANPLAAKKATDKTVWPIPIRHRLASGKPETVLMSGKSLVLESGQSSKLNLGETGFYRVKYTPDMLAALTAQMSSSALPVVDRWGIASNARALVEAGELPVESLLTLVASLRKETDSLVFSELLGGVLRIGQLYRTEKWHKDYQAYIRYILEPTVKRLGWEKKPGESHGDTLLRASVLHAYGINGDEPTVVRAIRECAAIVRQGVSAVSPDIRSVVYGLTAHAGELPEFNFLKRLYSASEMQEEKNRIARALCSFSSEALIEKALEFGFGPQVRVSDSWFFCAFVGMRSRGHDPLWKFLQKNWSEVLIRYGSGGHLVSKVISSLAGAHSMDIYKQMQKFFASHATPGAERTVMQTLERMHTAALWKERDKEAVARFLRTRQVKK